MSILNLDVCLSSDGFRRGEDQTEDGTSQQSREATDLHHPVHPQPFCHRRAGCLLLQHLCCHQHLPGGRKTKQKGNCRKCSVNGEKLLKLAEETKLLRSRALVNAKSYKLLVKISKTLAKCKI